MRGEAFFTRGYSHLSILRAPELHRRVESFLAVDPAVSAEVLDA
jgi:hypothetical protein